LPEQKINILCGIPIAAGFYMGPTLAEGFCDNAEPGREERIFDAFERCGVGIGARAPDRAGSGL
jgi:hypothetical protein